MKETVKKPEGRKFHIPGKAQFIFFIKFFVIPVVILLIAVRIFIIKTYERELFFSSEAYVQRAELNVSSEGYGNVSAINVNIGDSVQKGDILYKYVNTDLDDKIFNLQKKATDLLSGTPSTSSSEDNISINDFNKDVEFDVRAQSDGIIKEININIGDFVTKDETAMVMEDSEAFVASYIKVPVELINKVAPGVQSFIKLNNGLTLDGFVKDVSPTYDPDKNLLQADVLISTAELSRIDVKNIPSGTPVNIVILSPDVFTEKVKDFVSNIKIPIVKSYLSYEI